MPALPLTARISSRRRVAHRPVRLAGADRLDRQQHTQRFVLAVQQRHGEQPDPLGAERLHRPAQAERLDLRSGETPIRHDDLPLLQRLDGLRQQDAGLERERRQRDVLIDHMMAVPAGNLRLQAFALLVEQVENAAIAVGQPRRLAQDQLQQSGQVEFGRHGGVDLHELADRALHGVDGARQGLDFGQDGRHLGVGAEVERADQLGLLDQQVQRAGQPLGAPPADADCQQQDEHADDDLAADDLTCGGEQLVVGNCDQHGEVIGRRTPRNRGPQDLPAAPVDLQLAALLAAVQRRSRLRQHRRAKLIDPRQPKPAVGRRGDHPAGIVIADDLLARIDDREFRRRRDPEVLQRVRDRSHGDVEADHRFAVGQSGAPWSRRSPGS